MDLQASIRKLEDRAKEPDDEQPLSWSASLLRTGRREREKPKARRSGYYSVACYVSLLSKWALDLGRFLLMGVWEFFSDPLRWWQGTRESLQEWVDAQLQVLSRVLGMFLLQVYLNGIAWILLRIRTVGAGIRSLWRGIWGLPIVALDDAILRWGAGR